MGKFRVKEIIYNDGFIEYIIQQKRLFGLFWEDLQITDCINNIFKNELVTCFGEDKINKFITDDIYTAQSAIKWLSLDTNNICFKCNNQIVFGFPNPDLDFTYIVSSSLTESIRLKEQNTKQKYKNKRKIKQKHYISYNKECNEFYKY